MHCSTVKQGLKFLYAGLVMLTVIHAAGCGSSQRYLRPGTKIETIGKVAVLPLENYTRDDYAAEKMRTLINNELLLRGIEPVEPGEVARALREAQIRSVGNLRPEDLQKIGKGLGAQAVITGSVGAYSISRGISASYPEVSVQLTMHDVASGQVLWSAWHTVGGPSFWTRHFGTEGDTLSAAASKAAAEILDTFKPRPPGEHEGEGEKIWSP